MSDTHVVLPADSWEDVTGRALAGDEVAAQLLFNEFHPFLMNCARRRAPDLPDDLHEDVAQEVWLEYYAADGASPAFPSMPVKEALLGHLGHAVDRVRAGSRAPGERSRRRSTHAQASPSGGLSQRGMPVAAPVDELPDERSELDYLRAEARVDASLVVRSLPKDVQPVIRLMLYRDLSIAEAARSARVQRLRATRELSRVALRLTA